MSDGESDLVRVVRRDLEQAKRVDTFDGQLALVLAERVTASGQSAVAALSDELRAAVARALAGQGPEDDVSRARRQRAEKRRQLGLQDNR